MIPLWRSPSTFVPLCKQEHRRCYRWWDIIPSWWREVEITKKRALAIFEGFVVSEENERDSDPQTAIASSSTTPYRFALSSDTSVERLRFKCLLGFCTWRKRQRVWRRSGVKVKERSQFTFGIFARWIFRRSRKWWPQAGRSLRLWTCPHTNLPRIWTYVLVHSRVAQSIISICSPSQFLAVILEKRYFCILKENWMSSVPTSGIW